MGENPVGNWKIRLKWEQGYEIIEWESGRELKVYIIWHVSIKLILKWESGRELKGL